MNKIIWTNVGKMMERRGFVSKEGPVLTSTVGKFSNVYMQTFTKDSVTHVWHIPEKVNREFNRFLAENYSVANNIIIQADKMAAVSHADCVKINGLVFVEHMFEDEVMFDLIDACGGYTYEVLKVLPPKVKESKHNLKIMLETDRIARYFGWKKGTVVFVRAENRDFESGYFLVK